MLTHLRFSRREFRAVSRACRSIPLTEGSFAAFQPSLVRALALVEPGLARRVAAFRSYQVSILFEHLKKRDEKRPAFTAAECEAVAREVWHGRLDGNTQAEGVGEGRRGG